MFYIFNISYPKGASATLTYIQTALLHMNDATKKNSRVVSLAYKLSH